MMTTFDFPPGDNSQFCFFLVRSVFSLMVSPVNAWWWSSSLWFPTYNALQPKNGDNMSAKQGVFLHSLIFIWSLFFCGNLTQATWTALTCSISLAYLCLSSVFLLSSCSRCSIVLLSSSIIRSSESFLWTRTCFWEHGGQMFYNCFLRVVVVVLKDYLPLLRSFDHRSHLGWEASKKKDMILYC